MPETLIEQKYDTLQKQRRLRREMTIVEATGRIIEVMEREGVDKAELARRLGVTRGHVTRLLNGERNATLGTLSDVLWALGHKADIQASPLPSCRQRQLDSVWFDERSVRVIRIEYDPPEEDADRDVAEMLSKNGDKLVA